MGLGNWLNTKASPKAMRLQNSIDAQTKGTIPATNTQVSLRCTIPGTSAMARTVVGATAVGTFGGGGRSKCDYCEL